MQWQLFITTKLDIYSRSPKIISDFTGILVSDIFLQHIKSQGIPFVIINTIPELLEETNKPDKSLIITTLKTIPTFINKNFHRKVFNYSDIPINGNANVEFSKISTESLVALLNYIYATDRHKIIYTSELQRVINDAISYQRVIEINKLKEDLFSILKEPVSYENILKSSKIWGDIIYQSYTINDESYLTLIPQIDSYSDEFFLNDKMSTVFYASTPQNPKTVDKILHNIQAGKKDKIALLCFDCMGFAEWFLLKDYFSELLLEYDEKPVFALLPSVTSVSRQAIFSGNTDVYDIKYPNRNNEIANFSSFFDSKDVKSFSEKDEISDDALIGYQYINILYNFFDDLAHSVVFPKEENSKSLYFDAIKAYLNKSNLLKTVSILLKNNYNVYFCSDHGSVLAMGNGIKLEKYYIDSFAKRAVIIPVQADVLLENKKIKIPFIDNKLIVLPEGRTMFTNKDKKEINHGGTSIEEMAVPYVKVSMKL